MVSTNVDDGNDTSLSLASPRTTRQTRSRTGLYKTARLHKDHEGLASIHHGLARNANANDVVPSSKRRK